MSTMREYPLNWKPQTEEEKAYYSLVKESDQQSAGLYVELFQPLLVALGLHAVKDASFGRRSLPLAPSERAIRNRRGTVVRDADVYISKGREKGSVDSTKSAPKPLHSVTGDAWVHYQILWDETVPSRNADMVIVHGINDYGGKFTRHVEGFLKAGYRIILPDLPSHGRSSGLHAYVHLRIYPREPRYDRLQITTLDVLADAVHAVVCDVRHKDAENGDKGKRKLFICGQSMGGFTAIAYALRYKPETPQPSPYALESGAGPRPIIDGVIVLCPMLVIAPESRPSYALELLARGIASFGGRLPFAEAHKGKESEDPNVGAEFNADPAGYHGNVRVATGLAILKAIDEVNARLGEITVPIFIRHGSADRVTGTSGSQRLFDEVSSKDKSLEILPGCEHIILREGRDAEDDKPRQKVLQDMVCQMPGHETPHLSTAA